MPLINIIAAVDEKNGIGKDNQLLCYLPADLRHFKETTMGNPIIMGRKTFQSIGKPLPGRRNMVVSRQKLFIEGCEVASSLEEALRWCRGEKQVFIIGGSSLFMESLSLADQIYLTYIHHTFDADVFFPKIDTKEWAAVETIAHAPDEKNRFAYTFLKYKRLTV